jgi:hypothetical protein
MPVDPGDGSVSHAEEVLNNIHKQLYGKNHRWLKEHIDYRIPTHGEVERLLRKADTTFVAIPGNQITDWQLLQTVIFAAAKNYHITDTAQSLNRWYNQHILELENGVNRATAVFIL